MSPELVDSYDSTPDLTGGVMLDQHPVAEKFLADGGARRVNCAGKSLAFRVFPHKYARFFGVFLAFFVHVNEFFIDFISKFRKHVNLEEFICYAIPAIIIPFGYLSLDFNELAKALAAFAAPVAFKFRHIGNNSMSARLIKIGHVILMEREADLCGNEKKRGLEIQDIQLLFFSIMKE